jgi:cobyrinic acid a,c-diamide synthase
MIAGLGGDTGKTSVSVGLCRVWKTRDYRVIPFKKGPDYIDMGWLGRAARHSCYNVDLFIMSREQVLSSFQLNTRDADIAVIEGNRGLYDGLDAEGSVSTAEIAKLLASPVILVVNCRKVTRTVAAMVLGCQTLDSAVPIKAVILNNLAGLRHETVIRKSIENYCHLPVVGAIPKMPSIPFPGRHLGLIPPEEHPGSEEAIEKAAAAMEKYIDIKQLQEIGGAAPSLPEAPAEIIESAGRQVNIGIIRDSAFQFYYPENIDALERAGARLVEFSALNGDLPSSLDALYIGGGFPETHARELAANETMRRSIRKAAGEGLPIYAECGGLMYLAEELVIEERTYPMAGVFPLVIGISRKPKGHGYTILEVAESTPYFKTGLTFHGHEFHYSFVQHMKKDSPGMYFAFKVHKGDGILNGKDGLCYKNVLATYSHLHAGGTKEWAQGILNVAYAFQRNLLIN